MVENQADYVVAALNGVRNAAIEAAVLVILIIYLFLGTWRHVLVMVLALPTVGPLMLQALMTEDTYLAGSMLMVLSLLGVFGTLVSDLLLLWLDPRIRFS